MKYSLFILFSLFSVLASAEQTLPENFGAKNSKAYYAQVLDKQGHRVSERKAKILDACKEEIGLNQKACVNVERISFACMGEISIIQDHIDYCVIANAEVLSLEKTLKINFLFSDPKGNYEFHAQLKNMFYSAVECTKAFYEREGINLALTLIEVDQNESPDVFIREYSSGAAHSGRIPLSDPMQYYSHGKLCQLVAHELSHHLALPDRYQRYDGTHRCEQQTVYPEETLMAMHGRNGFAGYSALVLHEHDFHNMFYRACPNTIERFTKTGSGATDLGVDGVIPQQPNKWWVLIKGILWNILLLVLFLVALVVFTLIWNSRADSKSDEEK